MTANEIIGEQIEFLKDMVAWEKDSLAERTKMRGDFLQDKIKIEKATLEKKLDIEQKFMDADIRFDQKETAYRITMLTMQIEELKKKGEPDKK